MCVEKKFLYIHKVFKFKPGTHVFVVVTGASVEGACVVVGTRVVDAAGVVVRATVAVVVVTTAGVVVGPEVSWKLNRTENHGFEYTCEEFL